MRSAFHWSDYSLCLMDHDRGEAIFWVRSVRSLPSWTIASPFRTLFHWWLETRGAQLVHAACVGFGGRGVLITGRGGVGKSTITLTCLMAGCAYVGDDYVVLTNGEIPAAHSLYGTAKITRADMGRFGPFAPKLLGNAADEKAVITVERSIVPSLDLVGVLTPRFTESKDARIEPVDYAVLAGATSYTTIAQLPHAGQRTVDFLAAILDRLPGRSIALGTDRDSVVPALREFIAEPPCAEVRTGVEALPLVSIVIPVYNGAAFLAQAVESLLGQDHPKLEIIVVDDGSTDDIAGAVEALPVQVRFLRQPNSGPASARNLGIRATSAELIGFLDVDDLLPPRALQAELRWLQEHPECDVAIGRGQLLEHIAAENEFRFVGSPAESFASYIGSALYRRRAFERNGLFDPLLRFGEDVDWFARAGEHVRVDRLDMVTLHIRRHAGNVTRNKTSVELSPLRLAYNMLKQRRTVGSS